MKDMSKEDRGTDETSGAVYRGFEGNQVQNRKARCHYGIRFSSPFRLHVDEDREKRWCQYEERWMVDGHMNWYIKRVRNPSLSWNST